MTQGGGRQLKLEGARPPSPTLPRADMRPTPGEFQALTPRRGQSTSPVWASLGTRGGSGRARQAPAPPDPQGAAPRPPAPRRQPLSRKTSQKQSSLRNWEPARKERPKSGDSRGSPSAGLKDPSARERCPGSPAHLPKTSRELGNL